MKLPPAVDAESWHSACCYLALRRLGAAGGLSATQYLRGVEKLHSAAHAGDGACFDGLPPGSREAMLAEDSVLAAAQQPTTICLLVKGVELTRLREAPAGVRWLDCGASAGAAEGAAEPWGVRPHFLRVGVDGRRVGYLCLCGGGAAACSIGHWLAGLGGAQGAQGAGRKRKHS